MEEVDNQDFVSKHILLISCCIIRWRGQERPSGGGESQRNERGSEDRRTPSLSPEPGSNQHREYIRREESRVKREDDDGYRAGLPKFRDERDERPREDKYRERDDDGRRVEERRREEDKKKPSERGREEERERRRQEEERHRKEKIPIHQDEKSKWEHSRVRDDEVEMRNEEREDDNEEERNGEQEEEQKDRRKEKKAKKSKKKNKKKDKETESEDDDKENKKKKKKSKKRKEKESEEEGEREGEQKEETTEHKPLVPYDEGEEPRTNEESVDEDAPEKAEDKPSIDPTKFFNSFSETVVEEVKPKLKLPTLIFNEKTVELAPRAEVEPEPELQVGETKAGNYDVKKSQKTSDSSKTQDMVVESRTIREEMKEPEISKRNTETRADSQKDFLLGGKLTALHFVPVR